MLILGMHRSGTTAVARLLQALGLSLGRRVSDLAENPALVELHELLLRRAGGSWEYPRPLLAALTVPQLRDRALDLLRAAAPESSADPWGWKDPRTCFFVPLWKEIYGAPTAIVVRRDGRDVAASLAARARRHDGAGRDPFGRARIRTRLRDVVRRVEHQRDDSVRCWSPDAALTLWGEYNATIDAAIAEHGIPSVVMRLEDLVERPRDELARIARSAGLPDDREAIERALSEAPLVQPRRRPDLWPSQSAIAATAAQLERYGYDPRGAAGEG